MKKVFYSYASEDFRYLKELDEFLNPLRGKGYIETWHDHQIYPGEKWEDVLEEKLRTADIVVFLISPSLLNSQFVLGKELPIALERMNFGQCQIFPILLRKSLWEETDFAPLEILPEKAKPIISGFWSGRREEAYYIVAQGILRYIKNELNLSKQQVQQSEGEIISILKNKTSLSEIDQIDPQKWDEAQMLENEIERIADYKPTILQVLKASSFDKNASLDGHLSFLVFRKKLMATTQEILDFNKRLVTLIEGELRPARIIFLTGYPGTGKTTFIHAFMNDELNKKDYEFTLYDLDDFNINRPVRRTDDAHRLIERSVLDVFNMVMAKDEEMVIRTFRLIAKNRDFLLKNTFISKEFHKDLEQISQKEAHLEFIEAFKVLQQLDYKNSFTCFFIYLFNTVHDDRRKVIVLDNLDAVDVEHLSSHFLSSFSQAIWNANNLAQSGLFDYKRLEFTRRFKFVFCMREANFEYVNAHQHSHLGLIDEVPLKFSLDTIHFREIVERRLNFYLNINKKSEENLLKYFQVRQWFDAFLNDEYFSRVFVPLYNGDFRSSVATLLAIAEASSAESTGENLSHERTPLRGILFFQMIKDLRIRNFLKDYAWLPGSFNGQLRPYCYLERMLLTTVLNYSQIRGLDEIESAQPVSLGRIIQDLKIAYTPEEILESLAKCFLYHRSDWAHLVTIQDREVRSEEFFVSEMQQLHKRNPQELDKIKIRLNPAGFIFLRYLLPHFEFYSVVAGNLHSLYQTRLNKIVDESRDRSLVFDFEPMLSNVYNLAKLHIESMASFFKIKFLPHMTYEEYRDSRFTFKHFGSGGPQNRGYFHSTRIITAHISYLDTFRHFILNKKSMHANVDIKDFNRVLCNHIERYIHLLKNSLDDRAIKHFYSGFEHNLNTIRSSGYEDTTTLIQAREL